MLQGSLPKSNTPGCCQPWQQLWMVAGAPQLLSSAPLAKPHSWLGQVWAAGVGGSCPGQRGAGPEPRSWPVQLGAAAHHRSALPVSLPCKSPLYRGNYKSDIFFKEKLNSAHSQGSAVPDAAAIRWDALPSHRIFYLELCCKVI